MTLPTTQFEPPRIDVPIGRVDDEGNVRLNETGMRQLLTPLVARVGGQNAPSNAALGAQGDALAGEVATLEAEVADLEANAVRKDALGGDDSILALKNFSLANQVHRPGYTVLWLTASASGARCNNEYGVPNPASYSRTTVTMAINGVSAQVRLVEFDCAPFPDCDEGRQLKVAAANRPDLLALCEAIDATPNLDGTTHVRCYELWGDFDRPDVAAGSVADNTMTIHDMQSSSNTHAQIAKANGWLGGVLDVLNLGVGGSNTSFWQDAELRRYVESLPHSDLTAGDFGVGNDMTQPVDATAVIAGRLDECVTWGETLGGQFLLLDPPGARLGGDATPVANPQLTPDFTTLQVAANYLKGYIATRHRTVLCLDSEDAFMRTSSFGLVDTTDLTRGQPAQEIVESKGVHLAPTGNDEIAIDLAEAIRPLIGRRLMGSNMRPDFVFSNSVPDAGGIEKNPNLLYPWFGAAPTVPVTFTTYIVGEGIEGTTCEGSGFTGAMNGVLSVVPDEVRGGVMMRMHFNDPRPSTDPAGNATLRLLYRGPAAYPLVDAFNDPDAQTDYVDFLGRVAVYGFQQDSVFQINAGFVTVDAGAVTRKVASLICDDGINGMVEAQRAWCRGLNPDLLRAGNGRCRIPRRVYTDAYFLLEIVGTPIAGYPMGDLYFEVALLQAKRRRLLLAPVSGKFA